MHDHEALDLVSMIDFSLAIVINRQITNGKRYEECEKKKKKKMIINSDFVNDATMLLESQSFVQLNKLSQSLLRVVTAV